MAGVDRATWFAHELWRVYTARMAVARPDRPDDEEATDRNDI
jgi:hypothetical protein